MSKIYITGDCHGNFKRFTKRCRMRLPFMLSEDDLVIVCGDFALCWANDAEFRYNCDWLSRLPFKILFVDGNHENFDMLNNYPIEIWNGGKVHHIIRDKVIHLMRGQVFEINDKTFFTMGGASSVDVLGGILSTEDPLYDYKRKRAIRLDLSYRVIGKTYWFEELPSQDELNDGLDSLKNVNYKVDYVISHCLPSSYFKSLEFIYKEKGMRKKLKTDLLTDYFEDLEKVLNYSHWYCGHYHLNLDLDNKHTILYEDIVPIKEI